MNLSTLQSMLWLMRTMGVALLENVFIFVVFSSTRKTILSARLVSRDRRYQSRTYRDAFSLGTVTMQWYLTKHQKPSKIGTKNER